MGFLKKGLTESINLDGFISPYVCIFIIISRILPVKKFQPILSQSKVWPTPHKPPSSPPAAILLNIMSHFQSLHISDIHQLRLTLRCDPSKRHKKEASKQYAYNQYEVIGHSIRLMWKVKGRTRKVMIAISWCLQLFLHLMFISTYIYVCSIYRHNTKI